MLQIPLFHTESFMCYKDVILNFSIRHKGTLVRGTNVGQNGFESIYQNFGDDLISKVAKAYGSAKFFRKFDFRNDHIVGKVKLFEHMPIMKETLNHLSRLSPIIFHYFAKNNLEKPSGPWDFILPI